MPAWVHKWLQRHQNPVSQVLHAIGIPLLGVAGVLVVVQLMHGAWSLWWRPVLAVTVSYLLQWIGHCIEGNTMGELILINKALGRPYVAVAPRNTERDALSAPAESDSTDGGSDG